VVAVKGEGDNVANGCGHTAGRESIRSILANLNSVGTGNGASCEGEKRESVNHVDGGLCSEWIEKN